MDRAFSVFQFVKRFPLGGTCFWTGKALRLTVDSLLLGWVHQRVSVDGAASGAVSGASQMEAQLAN